MKEKFGSAMKKFAVSLLQPVMVLAIGGLLIALSVFLQLDFLPEVIRNFGAFMSNLLLNAIIYSLPILFCVGITTSLAKAQKGEAAIIALTQFLIFLFANHGWLESQGMLAVPDPDVGFIGTGQTTVIGVQVVDTGVLSGILLGVICAWCINKFKDMKFKGAFSYYGGVKFALLVNSLITVVYAIALCYIWPPISNFIMSLSNLISSTGLFGVFIYNFLQRFLLPLGLHMFVIIPFYISPLGGTMTLGGQAVSGALPIWMTELALANEVTTIDPSMRWLTCGFAQMCGCIAMSLAMIKTARPEKKTEVKDRLIPAISVVMLAGITEPFEFQFAFVSPILWFVHSLVDAFSQLLLYVLGCRLAFTGSIIDAVIDAIALPASATKWFIAIIAAAIVIPIWYFIGVFIIKKFNLATPGREEEEDYTQEDLKKVAERNKNVEDGNLGDVLDIIDGLGGKENIDYVTNCLTRLRVDVKDVSKVDDAKINKFINSGIVKNGNNVQIIIGLTVSDVKDKVCKALGID